MTAHDEPWMQRALTLAEKGRGYVEPNPLVGAIVVRDGKSVGEGWHEKVGHAHAEVNALRKAGDAAKGATLYVTLEPCCHHGKTPPCTEAIIRAGIRRVIAAMRDPFPKVAGGGIQRLTAAGIDVDVGLHERDASELNAPYLKLLEAGRPWVIAKWAMTLDGKLATRSGDSRWISGEASRRVVHELRGRVDAIVVGRRTAELDDPLLTARLEQGPPPRVATRIVLDSRALLASTNQLVRTVSEIPTLVVAGRDAGDADVQRLTQAGCEVLQLAATDRKDRLLALLDELGHRRMTNLLVEGGSELLGALFDAEQIDETHVFVAPKLIGGIDAPSPLGGAGLQRIASAVAIDNAQVRLMEGGDVYWSGRLQWPSRSES
jgi:diaminohydroxyphosphoribosylaminopyrimidine deaminase / 5-amino-6-(5-phosphoribosylamino)uracil reductase